MGAVAVGDPLSALVSPLRGEKGKNQSMEKSTPIPIPSVSGSTAVAGGRGPSISGSVGKSKVSTSLKESAFLPSVPVAGSGSNVTVTPKSSASNTLTNSPVKKPKRKSTKGSTPSRKELKAEKNDKERTEAERERDSGSPTLNLHSARV